MAVRHTAADFAKLYWQRQEVCTIDTVQVDVAQKSSVNAIVFVHVDVQSMAWLGQKVVLCTSLRYMLLQPTQGTSTQLFALAEDAPSPTLVQSIPSANLAVLLMVLFCPSHHLWSIA